MKILLCNDDGYDAIGINLLYNKLQKYGEVFLVAPRNHMSAKSCAATFSGIAVEKVDEHHFIVDGTPADCCSFAINGLNLDVDIVISGCNAGLNISYDTMYSGTIGVCLEAMRCGKKAIAFSCDFNFDFVDKHFEKAMDFIFENELLGDDFFLNVNFPIGEELKGIALSKLYYRHDRYWFTKKDDGLYYPFRECENEFDDQNTDCYMVNNGIISITPLSKTYFNERYYDALTK